MHLQNATRSGCLLVTVGEPRIDAATAIQFKDEMRRIVEDGPDRVILDMAAVDSIDSSGLGAIVSIMKFLGAGRRLELAALSPKVHTVFRLTRMDAVITIHDSAEDALDPVERAS